MRFPTKYTECPAASTPSRREGRTRPRVLRLLTLGLLAAACTEGERAPAPSARAVPACDESGAREVVERLGQRLQQVSLLAPDSIVTREIREAYAPLVTPALLHEWIARPADAPGREASSPWPARIEVKSVTPEGAGTCRVQGDVVYLTSAELARGGVASRVPVTIQVVEDGRWRVSAYDAIATSSAGVVSAKVDSANSGRVPPDTARTDSLSTSVAEVLRRYYAAIAARDYRAAYELWDDGGRASGQSFEDFAAGFARTVRVEVEVGRPGRVEGAAGSRYVEVPVVIHATSVSGEPQRFEGTYTLRRSVVDGASAEQRRWHIYSARISQSR